MPTTARRTSMARNGSSRAPRRRTRGGTTTCRCRAPRCASARTRGDIHAFNVNQLKLDFDNLASPAVAAEFVGSSITSQGWSQDRLDALRPDNPHVLYSEARYRGYVRVEVTPKRLSADLRGMESVQSRYAACSTLATFVVDDGIPGAKNSGPGS